MDRLPTLADLRKGQIILVVYIHVCDPLQRLLGGGVGLEGANVDTVLLRYPAYQLQPSRRISQQSVRHSERRVL